VLLLGLALVLELGLGLVLELVLELGQWQGQMMNLQQPPPAALGWAPA
jgi:hypothetical protein